MKKHQIDAIHGNIEQLLKKDVLELIGDFLAWCNNDCSTELDTSNIERVEMNAFDDIVYYKDGTSKIVYHCCD